MPCLANTVVDTFELLCALLALEMLKANVLSITLASGGVDSTIWANVQDAAYSWLNNDTAVTAALQAQYDALPARKKTR